MTRYERWLQTGWDRETGVNPPPNEPKAPPVHTHGDGWPVCQGCMDQSRLDRALNPTKYTEREKTRGEYRERER